MKTIDKFKQLSSIMIYINYFVYQTIQLRIGSMNTHSLEFRGHPEFIDTAPKVMTYLQSNTTNCCD